MVDQLQRLERVDQHRLGMIFFIASESVFFGLLIFTYMYFRGAWAGREGAGADMLNIPLAAIFTSLLLASSVTIWLAERSLADGRHGGMRTWLLVTILLGSIFLVGQSIEYATLFAEGVTISTGQFGATFFTLTGFHGLHVLGGLVMLAILFGLAMGRAPTFRGRHSGALDAVSIYWHFVDVVWIVVFSIIYLWTLFT